jgi:NAD-dependent dihydropyrimidine dehydrogenase PreA subunit
MYRVDEATCTGCGDCAEACPAGAISLIDGRAQIDDAACADCGSCADACPQGAILIADAASLAYAAIGPGTSIPAAVPGVASVDAGSLAHRPEVEVLPAEPRRSRLWPMVGGALAWAARELLPEVIAAWRTPRAGDLQPISRNSTTFGLAAFTHRRTGHRHRWGRA